MYMILSNTNYKTLILNTVQYLLIPTYILLVGGVQLYKTCLTDVVVYYAIYGNGRVVESLPRHIMWIVESQILIRVRIIDMTYFCHPPLLIYLNCVLLHLRKV